MSATTRRELRHVVRCACGAWTWTGYACTSCALLSERAA